MSKSRRKSVFYRIAVAVIGAIGLVAGPGADMATALSVPYRPYGVLVRVEGTSATVTWANRTSATRPIDSWEVTIGDKTVTVGKRSATFADLEPGIHRASVRAVNEAGRSSVRNSAQFSIVVKPSAPTAVAATVDDGEIVVSWRPPTSDGGDAVNRYRVVTGGKTFTFGSTRRSATMDDAEPGRYEYAVSARNDAGWGPASIATIDVFEKPGRPRSVAASADRRTVTVTWRTPTNTGGGIDTYEVVVGSQRQTVTGTSATFTNVPTGTQPAKVRARNPAGVGSYRSAKAVVVRDVPGPARSVRAETEGQRVTVTWQAPADDGNSPLTGYDVTVAGVTKQVTSREATFDAVDRGDVVAIVRARNAIGVGPTASSNDVSIRRPFDPFNSVTGFVDQQYRDFFGRVADDDGLAFWSSAVGTQGENVAEVIEQFARSSEFEHRRSVTRLYLAYFNRLPEADGFDFWSNRLASRQSSLDDVSQFFASSTEFDLTYGELSDAQFVALVYANVLVRGPEQDGFVYWLGRLRGGMTRGQMMTHFSESTEFRGLSQPAVDVVTTYRGMLGRTPSGSELSRWLGPLSVDSGAIRSLIATIYTSDEYGSRIRP